MIPLLCACWFLCCGVAWGNLPHAGHTACYYADGAGNVTALMDAQEGIAARYLYNPFGRLTGQWGPMAEANRYRFSSKEVHAASGLSYYGFRFYDAGLQRWLNPDPLGEGAGPNLYEAFSNNPLLFADRDGLDNMYNMPAGNNAVPDIVASMPVGEGGVISGYREGIDPLFLLGSLTPFDPNQLLSLPGPLNDLVTLASASSTGNEKLQAGAGLAVWALTKGKKLGMSAKPCPAAKTIDPATVRFSQSSISRNFSSGGAIEDLAVGLRNGSVNPANIQPIRLVEQDGNLFSLDNRRLWSFQQAEVPVPFRMATPQEAAGEAWKFTTPNGGTSIRVRGQ